MVTQSSNLAAQPGAKDVWRLMLISLSIVMGFQVVRVFVEALVTTFGERYGQTLAVVPILIVFLAPFLTPVIVSLFGPRNTLWITLGGLAIFRLLMQISRDVNLNMIFSGIATLLALMGLSQAFSYLSGETPIDRRRFAQGIFIGMAIDVALQGVFFTWDYVWQPGIIPLITAVLVSGLALFSLVGIDIREKPASAPTFRSLLPIAALGPMFMLELLFLQNMAFVASSSQITMETAFATILIGDAAGLSLLHLFDRQKIVFRLIAGIILVITAALLPLATGTSVIIVVIVGQGLIGGFLSSILNSVSSDNTNSDGWRMSIVVGIGSLLFIFLSILYYISGLVSLPFTYTILPPVAAVFILLTAFVPPVDVQADRRGWQLAGVPLALLIIPLILLITRPIIPAAQPTSGTIRFLDYNIHQGINFYGWVDPEATAQFIESQQADVIALQEISRGWMVAGSVDVAEWLSRRLQMPYVYAPGHDYQFGNIILTRLPITDWSFTRLPLHNVPLGRSLIQATIDLGNGKSFTLINTHLSAYASTDDRIPQVEKVIEVWNKAPRTIIVGDMNAHLQDADMNLFLQAGLTSAQDATGNAAGFTFSSVKPTERIDWIFGTPEFHFSDFVIPPTTASDHLPLVVTVALTG